MSAWASSHHVTQNTSSNAESDEKNCTITAITHLGQLPEKWQAISRASALVQEPRRAVYILVTMKQVLASKSAACDVTMLRVSNERFVRTTLTLHRAEIMMSYAAHTII